MARIVFIGDSITKGVDYGGVLPTETFCNLIGVASGYSQVDIFNKGTSLNNSADGLARFQTDVVSLNPDVCVIMFGNNDARGTDKFLSPAAYKANIKAMIDICLLNNIKPTIMSFCMERGDSTVFSIYKPYLAALEDLVGQYDIGFVDIFRELCYSACRVDYLPRYVDHVHQSKIGHQEIANYAMLPKHAKFFKKTPIAINNPSIENLKPLLLVVSDFLLESFHPNLTTAIQAEKSLIL